MMGVDRGPSLRLAILVLSCTVALQLRTLAAQSDPMANCYEGQTILVNETSPTSVTADLPSSRSGTVLVCENGTFGAVCANNWDSNDAAVVCRSLGFSTSPYGSDSAFAYQYLGPWNGPIFADNVMCNGTEYQPFDCEADDASPDCQVDAGLAAVTCERACYDGETRLVGGRNPSEGVVQVCRGSSFGTICDVGWDDTDAIVACRSVEFYYGGMAVDGSIFDDVMGPIVISNVSCFGDEFRLSDCANTTDLPDMCSHATDAAVMCQPGLITVTTSVVMEIESNYTVICNAETPVPANLTDFHWISPQGERVYPSEQPDRIRVVITNYEFRESEYVTILNSSLFFRPLAIEDAGLWTCNVTFDLVYPGVNLSNQTLQDIIVNVPGPEVTVNDGISSAFVVEGDNFTTICTAAFTFGINLGNVQITWYFGEEELPANVVGPIQQIGLDTFARLLSLSGVDVASAGVYRCTATAVGEFFRPTAVSQELGLEVIPQSPPTITEGPADQEVVVFQAAMFQCAVTGIPAPEISWSVGERLLMNSTETVIMPTIDGFDITSFLTIREPSPEYNGASVTCSAENVVDSASASAVLTVLYPANITVPPVDQTVNEGDPITLSCTAFGYPPPLVTWTLPGREVLLSNDSRVDTTTVITELGYYIVTVDLTIAQSTTTDAGVYICTALNDVPNEIEAIQQASATVVVQTLPAIVEAPVDQTYTVGEPARFTCVATGIPVPAITWTVSVMAVLDGSNISMSTEGNTVTSNLDIREVSLNYADATVTCVAENAVGIVTASASLDVLYPAEITEPPSDEFVFPGDFIELVCTAFGIPGASIRWSTPEIEDLSLIDNENITVVVDVSSDGVTQSGLFFDPIQPSDTGVYTCTVSNDVENLIGVIQEASAELLVLEELLSADITLEPTDLTEIEGLEASFTCSAFGNPRPSISWYMAETVLMNDETYTIEDEVQGAEVTSSLTFIATVQLSGSTFTCRAENTQGNDTSAPAALDVQILPEVVVPPVDVVTGVDASVEFSCSIRGKPNVSISWWMGGVQLQTNAELGIAITNSFPELYTTGSLLALAATSIRSAGTYLCVGSNDIGTTSVNATLTVETAPVITTPPEGTEVTRGERVEFYCEAVGYPMLTELVWELDGTQILSEGPYSITSDVNQSDDGTYFRGTSRLVIASAQKAEAGRYTCTFVNALGRTTSDAAILTVLAPPVFTVRPQNVMALVSESVMLSCSATGQPQPSIRWLNSQGEDIVPSTSVTITETTPADDEFLLMSVLTFLSVSLDDSGTYVCSASNEDGTITTSAILSVTGPPVIVTRPQDQSVSIMGVSSDEQVSFTCQARAVPAASIRWNYTSISEDRVEIQTVVDNSTNITTSTLTLSEVGFVDTGSFVCTASNGLNPQDSAEADLTVYVIPELTLRGQPTRPLTEGDRLALECDIADGWPEPSVNWLLNGIPVFSSVRVDITTNSSTRENDLYFVRSTFMIPSTIPGDTGIYSCRAAQGIPGAPPLVATTNVTVQARNECVLTVEPLTTPCLNGFCVDDTNAYVCICNEGFTGVNCTEPVIIPLPPSITDPPRPVTTTISTVVNLTCLVTGSPDPVIAWFKDGEQIANARLQYYYIPSVTPDDRGNYRCTASNEIDVATSDEALLLLTGVREYLVGLALSGGERRKRQNELEMLLNTLVGTSLGGDTIIYSATAVDSEDDAPSIVVTVASQSGNLPPSGELTGSLSTTLTDTAAEFGFEVLSIVRYDGCPMETTVVYRYEEESLGIVWPETELGGARMENCPCTSLTNTREMGSRVCGGDFTSGVVWDDPVTTSCSDLSVTSIRLCLAATEGVVEESEEVEEITGQILAPVDITIASEILEDLLTAVNDTTVRDNTLDTIDNLLDQDPAVLADSQEEGNATSRILDVIEEFGDIIDLGDDNTETLAQDNYVIHVDERDVNTFGGITLELGTDIDRLDTFQEDSISTVAQEVETNRTGACSFSLPDTFLNDLIRSGFGAARSRFNYAIFRNDSLFQPRSRDRSSLEVASVIVSVSVAGFDRIEGLSRPARSRFQLREGLRTRGRDPRCVFWDETLDVGYGDFSTDGCTLATSTDTEVECECTHLTSFAVLLDVSPEEEEEDEEIALEVITYIGLGISIIALVLTIITYLLSRKLRRSDNGRLLVNMCFALLGLFIVFILSGQAEHYPDGLCGFFSALLHYFMLAYFFWTGAEAIFLYLKLVKVFMGSGFFIKNYVWISMAIAWLAPVIIVVISLAGYEYYTSDEFCRPYRWPFWFGFILPFAVIYIFNWIMFILIMVSLIRHAAKSADVTKTNRSAILRHVLIAIILSLLFGLGWAFGLIGTSSLPEEVYIPAQYIFSIFVGLQGVFIFVFHTIRSPDAREEWKRWWYTVTGRGEKFRVLQTASTTGTLRTKYRQGSSDRPTSATSATDSFRLASATSNVYEKSPLTADSEKLPDVTMVSAMNTSVALDTILENPEASGEERREDVEKGELLSAEDQKDDDKTTRL